MQKIIGISGKAGSGKDHVTNRWRRLINFNLYETTDAISYADALKEVCCNLFGWDYASMSEIHYKESMEDTICKKLGMSRRQLLQSIGTDAFRNVIHEDIWCMVLNNRITELASPYVFIRDHRFINEIENTRSLGGKVIRINRIDTATMTKQSEHQSEISLDNYSKWDDILINDPTKGDEHLDQLIKETHYKLFEEYL